MIQYFKTQKSLVILTAIISLINSLTIVFLAIILQQVLDVALQQNMSSFINTLLFSLGYLAFLGLFMFLSSLLTKKLICRIVHTLRKKTFNGITKYSIEDFNKINTADYISAITNDVKMVEENYLIPLLNIINNIVLFIASLALMIYFDIIITIFIIVAILFMIIIPSLLGVSMQTRQEKYSKKLSLLTINIKDLLSGFELIKSYCMQKHAMSKFEKSNSNTTSSKLAVDKIVAVNEAISMCLALILQIGIIFLSAYFIITGRFTAGLLLGIVQTSSNLVNPLLIIFNDLPKIKSSKPIVKRLNEFATYSSDTIIEKSTPTFQKKLSTKDLTFSYDGKIDILHNISLNINKGKKYALVGKSGCGKSTLVKIFAGYYSNYNGTIGYDSINIANFDPEKIMDLFAIIHQNVYMFDETIYDNICLYNNYSEEELEIALKISGVDLIIKESINGLSTMVGENGSNLSGGQKQRIAVARAIIRKKPILILDEGTSAIDMQTAYDIENKLLKIDNLTIITITHNMQKDILERYDQIIFMNDGNIAELGTFDELINNQGEFYNFFKLKK